MYIINMFCHIVRFFRSNKKPAKIFDERYRNGYANLWIQGLRDYQP